MQQAAWHGNDEAILRLVEEYGADLDARTFKEGLTAVEIAKQQGRESTLKRLEELHLARTKTLVCPDSGVSYTGHVPLGKDAGRGIFRSTDGHVYLGEFKSDRMDGVGMLRLTNGSVYFGEWKGGRMEGHGVANNSGTEVRRQRCSALAWAKIG